MATAILVQPYSKKAIKPTDILRFPWDETKNTAPVRMSREEQMKRMEELMKKWGVGNR